MLQQILRDMFIDPELLAELDEEQKQVLFCKMREEQVRRYHEREKKLEHEDKKKKRKPDKSGGRRIGFLTGADKKEWVWVMGEHKEDKSVEQILEEEAQGKARQLAEQEAEELQKTQDEEMQKLKEEEMKLAEEEKRRKDEENKRKSAEAAAAAAEQKKKQEEDRKQKFLALKKRQDYQRRKSVEELNKMKERRSSEIYMSFREARQQIEQQAKDCSKKIDTEWEEQEKKAKKAELEKRAIARRAREEHRRSLSTKGQVIGVFMSQLNQQREEAGKPEASKPHRGSSGAHMRNARPTDRDSIIEWFKEVEKPKGSGLDPQTEQVGPWFHGIITRLKAEELLEDARVGTFLVRVSERIWGYAISYRGSDRCKHFLIDTSDGSYQFFGTNQIAHSSLAELVSFHKSKPISVAGQELLKHSCVQKSEPPDYHDLFDDSEIESSYL